METLTEANRQLFTPTARANALAMNATLIKKRGVQQTALENALSGERLAWLAQYASKRWQAYFGALSGWRTKLERYQKQSEDDFSWRKKEANRNSGKSIFEVQNDSLNVVGAFSEFFTAQAKNDLFGATPWFAARPEGKADAGLADHLSKHAAWKLKHAGLVEVYNEAVKTVSDLGTCFTKKTWIKEVEEYEEPVTILQDAKTHKAIYTSTGEPIYAEDMITEEGDTQDPSTYRRFPAKDPNTDLTKGEYEYATGFRKASRVIYNNLKAYNLCFKDVAFDPLAAELSLRHTDFFHKFTKNLLDIRKDYQVSREDILKIHHTLRDKTGSQEPVTERGEEAVNESAYDSHFGALPNVPVSLVEGYMRVDATGRHKPVCIYVVFCPEIELILKVDYLANITPDGLLPVHAHTIERIAGRIVGRGFYEHLEKAQTIIDESFNRINWHDRKRSQPITGLDKSQLMQEDEEEDRPFDSEIPVNLKDGKKLEDYIQFKDYPDLSNRTSDMMQVTIQMIQLRKGITAASQGDMAGLPENNTATGIKQLISRSSVLLKAPIDDLKRSFTRDLYYAVKLLYANFDRDEAFVYGEGENMELIEIKQSQVQNLEVDIEILLTQAQNQFKLENAKAGIELFNSYSQLPEVDKQYGRSMFIQALRALDFADADQIIRPAAVDINSAMALLPPDVQQQLASVLQQPEVEAAVMPSETAQST